MKETTDAKAKYGRKEALELAQAASTIIAAKGRKVVSFDMKKDPPDEDMLLKHLLGPTGNLRAPAIRRGKTLLIGFDEETFNEQFS